MKFTYGKQDMPNLSRAQESCWLLANGLGGYASMTAAFSVTRADQGLLISARRAPNDRIGLVHRLSEKLCLGERTEFLSTQAFAGPTPPEEGFRHLSSFVYEYIPTWTYELSGVRVVRQCAAGWEANLTALRYQLENRSGLPCTLELTPLLQFAPKGTALREKPDIRWQGRTITGDGHMLRLRTNGALTKTALHWERLAYPDDEKDGRPGWGLAASCCRVSITVPPGQSAQLEVLFSPDPIRTTAGAVLRRAVQRQKALERSCGFRHPAARQLSRAAADFITRRDSTGGKTIVAGYPLFGDWGRDTMIALPGCVLARGEYETARSILRTFLAYEKDGLVPNLFPEGGLAPMYNTADAALLLINCVWLYDRRTGNTAFVREAWPVLERIIHAYRTGTRHSIRMDADGLISAGSGLDQVTWMDVCVDGILPTPRHGKPVEINAYWYNALRIMEALAPRAGADGAAYGALADQVRDSFLRGFWLEEQGYLKDVISGTKADLQLRCNQIWAVTMPFTMLSPRQEERIVDAVRRHLYTPCGLRSLSPADPEFHPTYGGPQKQRDLAYHQGTVWAFPLGAYYLAYLKVNGNSPAARQTVYAQLEALDSALREGCAGQLPEIYDGLHPGPSRGCYAQAWSVGELLRVYEALEKA